MSALYVVEQIMLYPYPLLPSSIIIAIVIVIIIITTLAVRNRSWQVVCLHDSCIFKHIF
jgi:hypothetical protein